MPPINRKGCLANAPERNHRDYTNRLIGPSFIELLKNILSPNKSLINGRKLADVNHRPAMPVMLTRCSGAVCLCCFPN